MLSRSLLILSISVLSGCLTQPTPPVVPECSLVAVEGIDPYLYCRLSDGSGERWRVKVNFDANKYICTTPEGYVDTKKYAQDVEEWIKKSCTSNTQGDY